MPSTLAKRTDGFLTKLFSGNSMSYKQVFAIILPVLVDQAFVVCLNLLNTAMVSSSGEAAIAAVSTVDTLNFFLMQVFIAVCTGGTVVVAQYKGSGKKELVSKATTQALSAVLLLSIVISIIMIVFHNPLLKSLFGKAEPAVLKNAQVYIVASALSYPCFAVYEAACGVLRGAAKTKSSLGLSLVYNITYVLCNVIFINVLGWGVIGLSISLNVSRFIGMGCSIIYLCFIDKDMGFKIKNMIKFDFNMIKKILFIGIPFAAEQMFFNGGKMLTQTFVVSLGTSAMTINAICNSMVPLFQICANAISLSAVTIVGQSIGRGDIKDARKFVRSLIGLGSFSFVVMVCIMLPLFPWIVQLFKPAPEIIPTVHKIIVMCGIFQPIFWSFSFITPSSLRAAGDSAFTSIASLSSMWLFRVIFGYVLGIVFEFGIIGVWIAMICEWAIRGTVFMLRYRTDKWYRRKVI